MDLEGKIITKLVELDASIKDIKDRMVTKDDLKATASRIMSHIDGIASGPDRTTARQSGATRRHDLNHGGFHDRS